MKNSVNLNPKKKSTLIKVFLLAMLTIVSCTKDETLDLEETTTLSSTNESFATPVAGKKYYIKNQKSGRTLDIHNKSNSNGANLQLWGTNTTNAGTHRQWQIVSLGNGYVRLKGVDSGKSLEVKGGSNSNGANVQQQAYDGKTHQQWQILSVGGGYFRLKCRDSGKSLWAQGTTNGSNVAQYAYNGWQTQKWYFTEVGSSVSNEEETTPPSTTPTTGSATHPSDLMPNCKQWKITYPDGSEDKTICNTTKSGYFYVNSSKNGIVFRAPIKKDNGTTPNSDYVRSELRERTADGKSDIYWDTDGTHVVYVKQAITHLPIVKNHLVATQIHGNKSEGIDDSMVLRLEGKKLFLSFNGGKLRSDKTIKTDYSLGKIHEVIFEVKNGKHYCYYSEDGKLKSAYASGNASKYLIKDGSNSHLMDRDYGDAYFKIGNYTQSNPDREGSQTGKSNNYGEVVVYDFYVKH